MSTPPRFGFPAEQDDEGATHHTRVPLQLQPQFEFVGTVEELVAYVSSLFKDGMRLEVRCRVLLPPPGQPEWFVKLADRGALPFGVRASQFAAVFDELRAGRRIGAIKAFREITNWSLKESVTCIDELFAGAHVSPPASAGNEFSLDDK